MAAIAFPLSPPPPIVVGSFGDDTGLLGTPPGSLPGTCDAIEIRLDLISAETRARRPWREFRGVPVLFTARRASEGGAGNLSARDREDLLTAVLDDAWLIDIELASVPEMSRLIELLASRGIPWVASYHDFRGPVNLATLQAGREASTAAGAAAFKAALELGWESPRLGELADFLQSPGLPISLMGMGPLAPVSRVLFAQLGSVLNYGYLGSSPTAPGQWSARQLTEAIRSVRHRAHH
jgi:3-dehydroquinate dehydratase type I